MSTYEAVLIFTGSQPRQQVLPPLLPVGLCLQHTAISAAITILTIHYHMRDYYVTLRDGVEPSQPTDCDAPYDREAWAGRCWRQFIR